MAIKFDTFKTTSGGAGTDNLDDVTSRGAITTNSITVGGVTVGTEYSLPATDGAADQVLKTDGSGNLSFTTVDVTGGLQYIGTFNATTGLPSLANAKQGDYYKIATGGTIYGKTWAVNDSLLINTDMGGTIDNSKIDKIDNTEPALTLDDVTTNGNTTTNAINVGTVTTSGDILADADATRTIGAEGTRFITAHTDINGAIRFKAKNNQGSTISKGQAVYISGISGTVPEVKLAQANSALTMPAFGLALANANHQAEVQVITFGNLTDYNTTTYSLSLGDTVYISETTAGALTSTAPTGEANLIQNIGRVLRADASAGIIKVGGAGRSNATPNLDQNKIFLGDSNNQAVSTALSSVALSSFNDDLSYLSSGDNVSELTNDAGYLANINSENLGDLSDVTITSAANGEVLSYNGSAWVNSAASAGSLAGLSDVTITAAANGEVLKYNGSAWVDANVDYTEITSTPTNVSTFTNDAGYLANINSENLGDLSDVTITGAAAGEYLRYSGSAWVDASLEVSDDTSPQLGGNLDTNSYEIVTALNADLTLRPNGTGAVKLGGNTNPAELRLYCENADAHYVGLKSPAHSELSASTVWKLPTADGTADQVLKTDGSGNLSFTTVGGGYTYASISGATSAQANYHYSCTATLTLTLPTSGISAGEEIRVKNMSTGTITIARNGVLIDGIGSDYTLDVQYSSVTLVYTGTNYEVV